MAHTEGTLRTADGLDLRLQIWLPGRPPRALAVLTHGHGEHSGRYGHVGQLLCDSGYGVYAYDLRGHGRSTGPRGHCPRFESYLDDLGGVLAHARQAHPGAPLFLLAHSLGGLITLCFALRRQPTVAGVAVSAPLLRNRFGPAAWKVAAARLLSGVWPMLTLSTGLDSVVPLSHDRAWLQSFPDLDLTHSLMTCRAGNEILIALADTLARAPEFKLPLLILQGEADGAVDPAAARSFYDRAASPDKTLKTYPGLYHEIFNETERQQVLGDLVAWLDARSVAASTLRAG